MELLDNTENRPSRPRRTPAAEEYLVRIFILLREGKRVVGARLAERMRVSPPAVTQALRRMARNGLVVLDSGNGLQLTEQGRVQAETTLRRHYLLERLLVNELGYNWVDADMEANRLEHALSPQLENHIFERLGRPTTCPHGNPFPGSPDEYRLIHARTLAEAQPGEKVTVLRVTEEGEEDLDLMHLLLEHDLLPGAETQVITVAEGSGCLALRTPRGVAEMPVRHAELVRVSGPDAP